MTLLMSFALSFLGSVATAKENVRATQVPRVIAQDDDQEEMPIEESDNEAARLGHQKSESESAEEPEARSASDASDQPLSIDELNVDETTESFEFLEEGETIVSQSAQPFTNYYARSPRLYRQDARQYANFDALFLQRNNVNVARPIVVDSSATDVGLLTTREMTPSIGTGVRLLYGNYGPDDLGWEVGYVGIYGMYANPQIASVGGSLQAPGDLGSLPASGLNDASLADAMYSSSIQSAEVNVVSHTYDGGYNRSSKAPWQRCRGYDAGHVDWLAGFRWAGLEESAILGFTQPGASAANTYSANTSSNLFAAQLGVRGRLAGQRWALEGWMKPGIALTSLYQSQSFYNQLAPDDPFRTSRNTRQLGMGMIVDMNMSAIYRIDETWGLRVGYNLMWLTGVALAPDQWDFSGGGSSSTDGTGLLGTGNVFLGGANLGLEARW